MRRLTSICLLLVLVAGCGGGSNALAEKEPEAWTTSVCRAFDSWVAASKNAAIKANSGTPSPQEFHAAIVVQFEEDVAGTDTFLDELEAAGAPAVSEGQTLAGELRAAVEGVRDALSDGQSKWEDVSIETEDDLYTGAAGEIAADSADAFGDLETAMANVRESSAEEIRNTVDESPDCGAFREAL